MKITAAVVHERSGPFTIEQVDLCDPRDDELLVEVIASGMCATDLHGRDAYYPTKFPKVFGHEGAGIVRAIGKKVSTFKPGDHVVMAYPWCGECPNCRTQRQSYCVHAFDLKMNGTRADGSTIHSKDGKPIYSAFFQQSSFGNFTIANERFAVKVRKEAPIESVAALACGGQTGAGAVLNVRTLQSIVESWVEEVGRMETLIAVLGVTAVALAALGVFGVVSFAVSRRRQELGIRLALGATRRDIYAAVVGGAVKPVVVGLIAGIGLALLTAVAFARLLHELRFAVSPRDPATYAGITLLLLAIITLALWPPARRAAAINPLVALRSE